MTRAGDKSTKPEANVKLRAKTAQALNESRRLRRRIRRLLAALQVLSDGVA